MSNSSIVEFDGVSEREPVEFAYTILPAERDVGIMSDYVEDFWPVVEVNPPFTKAEEKHIEAHFNEIPGW